MCTSGGGAGATVGTTVQGLNMIGARQARMEQKKLALHNARLQQQQVARRFSQQEEAIANQKFLVARNALIARGRLQATNLGERSIRAIGRALDFESGQSKAIITRNQEINALTAMSALQAIDVSHLNTIQQIGDTSDRGLTLGLIGISQEGISNSVGQQTTSSGDAGGLRTGGGTQSATGGGGGGSNIRFVSSFQDPNRNDPGFRGNTTQGGFGSSTTSNFIA